MRIDAQLCCLERNLIAVVELDAVDGSVLDLCVHIVCAYYSFFATCVQSSAIGYNSQHTFSLVCVLH